jgi:addiction module RelB/DinJ family antitoxin
MSNTPRSTRKRPSRRRVPVRKTATIRARVDPTLKERAEATFAEVGLSASAAITLFYSQVVRHGGLPFAVRAAPIDAGDGTAWSVLRTRAGTVPAPKDWASEHDYYVHGTTKRGS